MIFGLNSLAPLWMNLVIRRNTRRSPVSVGRPAGQLKVFFVPPPQVWIAVVVRPSVGIASVGVFVVWGSG